MKIGIVQFNPEFGEKSKNIRKVRELTGEKDVDLIVLPELFNTGYQFRNRSEVIDLAEDIQNGKTIDSLTKLADQKNAYIAAGMAEKDGDRLFNTSVLVSEQGLETCYRKIHLFYKEKNYFDPGDKNFSVFNTQEAGIGMMICFDWIFPEACRTLAEKGAEIIVHPSNLVLPHCPRAMYARSVENAVFTVTANRTGSEFRTDEKLEFTGKSQMLGPDGSKLIGFSEDEKGFKTKEIDPASARLKDINEHNHLFEDRRPEFYLQ